MEKSLFEQMGGTYIQVGDYLIPNLTLPEGKKKPIGILGQRHARYLKQHHKLLYMNLLTSGKLNAYLADIDKQAENMFSRLVKEMVEKQGVTEQLKATDQMAWVGKMNAIRNAAMEIVNKEPDIRMKSTKYYLYLSDDEYRLLLHTLVGFKNKLHREGRYTDAVDEVLIKTSKAKRKKIKVI